MVIESSSSTVLIASFSEARLLWRSLQVRDAEDDVDERQTKEKEMLRDNL